MALNLQRIFFNDSVSELVETINSNFEQIILNGGGPMGPKGFSGPPGFPGSENSSAGVLNFVPSTYEDSQIVAPPPMIATAKTDNTLMLSNIYLNEDDVPTVALITDSQPIAQKVAIGSDSPELLNYRIK